MAPRQTPGRLALVAIGLALVAASCSATPTPVVNTSLGPVQGVQELVNHTLVDKFLGVPFAKPPVDALRWRSPQVPRPWMDVLETARYGDACMQNPTSFTEIYPVKISEDCLYLNVYRLSASANDAGAQTSAAKVPVMLFFYGGSYTLGAASFIIYDAAELVAARGGDVIIVTANYRLNVFGYLASRDLLETDNSTGNWGLQDQRLAMRWVQENAAAFGGDPSRVTIFGESAGSGSVANHLVAPRSSGLFVGAIMESGPLFAGWVAHNNWTRAEEQMSTLKEVVNCTDVACLRRVPADVILKHKAPVLSSRVGIEGIHIEFAPFVDGVELADLPKVLAMEGKFTRVPIIIGTNENEGSTFVHRSLTAAQFHQETINNYGPDAQAIFKEYPLSQYESPFHAFSQILTDSAMVCPARETAANWVKHGVPAYRYHFTHVTALVKDLNKTDDLGVFHGSELPFVFHKSIMLWGGTPEVDLSDTFNSAWVSFAMSQVPTLPGSGAWPPYNATTDPYLRFDLVTTPKSELRKEKCDFWKSLSKGNSSSARLPQAVVDPFEQLLRL